MTTKTFAEIYCERYGVPRQLYRTTVFRQTLYPHARPLVAVLGTLRSDPPRAEYEFIDGIGDLTLARRKPQLNLRPLAKAASSFNRRHFQADFQFVDEVGRLTSYLGFPALMEDFICHYSNEDFSRRVLRLRISIRRMNGLLRTCFAAVEDLVPALDRGRDSLNPFGRPKSTLAEVDRSRRRRTERNVVHDAL